ncbi:aminotransferase class V-fold PLP-dependent enzyme [Micromonospora sp. NPDC050397]|uniref:aminotransferase class V-fold PLP-dependent enzyme n=1 Tax=Micromonospora sp. NPDC050397 TaxID=3364279 RepID=UPI00384F21A4
MRELTDWLTENPDPAAFPYPAVVDRFHRTGKHFVDNELLALLDQIRKVAATGAEPTAETLRCFLDVALDKWDERYDYQSYLALDMLPMPRGKSTDERRSELRQLHDRLHVHLIADALAFETAAESGATDLLPQQRPEPARVAKRYRLGVRAAAPALARLGRSAVVDHPDPPAAAAALHRWSVAEQSPTDRRDLLVSMLPVYLVHDEYLFIRMLQAYESTFAMLAVELRAAVEELEGGCPRPAADRLAYGRDLLNGAGPLFSLIATVQPDSFRTFRVYTEGASAIQSRSYKLMESLCRAPDESRVSSAAYRSVPEVRERVLAGQSTIEQAYHAISRDGRLGESDRHLLDTRMSEFANAVSQWRNTHYRIAVRMLGTRPGTGYTEGTPYLASARTIPVFTTTSEARRPQVNEFPQPQPAPHPAVREQFPLLKTCVYLNSNSTGAVPQAAEHVLTRYWETLRTWRDDAWDGWHDGLRKYTDGLAAFIGAPPGSVITDANLSTLLVRIASCFDYQSPRNRVVTTDLEFPTIPFIWNAFRRYGAELDTVSSGGPRFDEEELLRRIDERTLLVCVPHASYSSGATLDLERLVKHAHDVGALVIVDAFQTVGVMPLDVTALGVDFVLGGSHKWMCGVGTAFLYARPDLLPSLEPAATGWQAGNRAMTFQPSTGWAPDMRRLGGGTPFPLTSLVSQVGLDLLTGVGIDTIRAHSLACTERVITRAGEAGIPVVSPTDSHRRGGVVCLDVPDGEAVKRRLAERNMICSWRGYLRIGPHIYNTLDEIDEFMDTLTEVYREDRR